MNDQTTSSLAHSAPMDKVPWCSLSHGQVAVPTIPESRFWFSAKLQNYSNKPITFCPGYKEALPPLDTTKPDSHRPWLLCSLCSRGHPVWLHDLQCPLPLNCEHLWLINFCCLHLPSVGYYVFTNPHNPLTGLSPSLVRSRGGD